MGTSTTPCVSRSTCPAFRSLAVLWPTEHASQIIWIRARPTPMRGSMPWRGLRLAPSPARKARRVWSRSRRERTPADPLSSGRPERRRPESRRLPYRTLRGSPAPLRASTSRPCLTRRLQFQIRERGRPANHAPGLNSRTWHSCCCSLTAPLCLRSACKERRHGIRWPEQHGSRSPVPSLASGFLIAVFLVHTPATQSRESSVRATVNETPGREVSK